jgi:hypothetical protein
MAFSFRSNTWARAMGGLKRATPPDAGPDDDVGGADHFRDHLDGELVRSQEATMERMTWEEICAREELRGRWVALDGCRYDEVTGRATEGAVVDVDDDLAELCSRLRDSEWKNCAILFCAQGNDRPSPGPRH